MEEKEGSMESGKQAPGTVNRNIYFEGGGLQGFCFKTASKGFKDGRKETGPKCGFSYKRQGEKTCRKGLRGGIVKWVGYGAKGRRAWKGKKTDQGASLLGKRSSMGKKEENHYLVAGYNGSSSWKMRPGLAGGKKSWLDSVSEGQGALGGPVEVSIVS